MCINISTTAIVKLLCVLPSDLSKLREVLGLVEEFDNANQFNYCQCLSELMEEITTIDQQINLQSSSETSAEQEVQPSGQLLDPQGILSLKNYGVNQFEDGDFSISFHSNSQKSNNLFFELNQRRFSLVNKIKLILNDFGLNRLTESEQLQKACFQVTRRYRS